MHDRLFENQRDLEDEDLKRHAADAGLDLPRFEQEMAEHVHEPRVREDLDSALESGINGTPAFFINGVRHEGSYRFADLLAAVEAAEDRNRAARD